MREIIPAILPKDFDELERKLFLLKDVFSILGEETSQPFVQIDICDGVFVPTKTWPYTETSAIEQLAVFNDFFNFDIDLFVQNPLSVIPLWQKCLGTKRLILHIESLVGLSPAELFENLDVSATQFGFSVNLQTPLKGLEQFIRDADFFQFMGINRVGYQGEKFNKGVIKKIKTFAESNSEMIISVDGGVNLKNCQALVNAGANRLVVGSALFGEEKNAEDIAQIIKKFRETN